MTDPRARKYELWSLEYVATFRRNGWLETAREYLGWARYWRALR